MNWNSREEWASAAEHYVRTLCYASERVSHDISDYLSTDEVTYAAQGLRQLRTHVSRAIKALESGAADMDTLGDVAARMTNEARILNHHYYARLQMAAERATDEAVAAEVERRKTDEAWEQERERRASIDAMFGDAA